MARTVVIGAVVLVLAALVAVGGGTIGVTTVWPVLLGVAVGLAAAPATLGRISAYVVGAIASWAAMALGAALLPQSGLADAIALLSGLVIVVVIAAVTADKVPLWAGLIGYAAFAGLYEPVFAANPTLFLSESPVALMTVLLAGALGMAVASFAALVAPANSHDTGPEMAPATMTEEVGR
jgi:hypothetical protein